MRKIILDMGDKCTPEQIHPYIAEKMEFPPHYGNNLDALHDCLTEISEPTCVAIYNMDASQEYLCTLAEVMRDSEEENPNLCVVFAQQWLCDQL